MRFRSRRLAYIDVDLWIFFASVTPDGLPGTTPMKPASKFNVCTVASNENDAIELAKSNRPDVVVMDVYLGGTRAGIEAARWLREVCGVPIVFVTAYCDADTLERIHTVVPAAPVLSKPVYRQTLADAVSAATQ